VQSGIGAFVAADSDTESVLPNSIASMWGRDSRASRGPKRGLTLEQIVAAGVQVAQQDGLAAVSMNRLATDLGSSAMSLYRYVGNKGELLTLMMDAACDFERRTAEPGESWRDGLTRCANVYRDVLRRHTWILRIPLSAPPLLPNQIGWLEEALYALRDTQLEEQEKASIALLVSGYVRNEATLMADMFAAAAVPGSTVQTVLATYGQTLASLIDPAEYPALTKTIAAGAFDDDDDDMDREFDFGLTRLLDGVAVMVADRAKPRRSKPRK
jgi:AcrR family transcriptional regulator